MQTHLNVIVLQANDIEQTKHYLTQTLGFTVAAEHPGNVTEFQAVGGAEVAVIPAEQPFRAAGAFYWFIVPDFNGYFQQLTKAGATIVKPPHDTPFGRVFVVETPDGHTFTFHGGEL